MAPCAMERFNSHHHTFLTKRFDRVGQKRLHFTSAMTQLGYYDGDYDNSLNYDLAMEVAGFFRLNTVQAKKIYNEVLGSVSQWQKVAATLNIGRGEQQLMASAFNV
jgi:hypothetical protein